MPKVNVTFMEEGTPQVIEMDLPRLPCIGDIINFQPEPRIRLHLYVMHIRGPILAERLPSIITVAVPIYGSDIELEDSSPNCHLWPVSEPTRKAARVPKRT